MKEREGRVGGGRKEKKGERKKGIREGSYWRGECGFGIEGDG